MFRDPNVLIDSFWQMFFPKKQKPKRTIYKTEIVRKKNGEPYCLVSAASNDQGRVLLLRPVKVDRDLVIDLKLAEDLANAIMKVKDV